MINQFFRTRSWISKVTGGVTILAMFVGFVPMLLLPTPAFAATIPITNGSFGSGSDQNDIASWEEKGSESDSSTLAKNPTSGDDSASPDGGRFAKIGRYQPNPGQDHNGFICQQINAVGYNSLVLKYFWRGDADAEDNSDLGRVEYLLNGSCESADNQWTSITTHELDNGNTGVTSWSSLQSLNLPSALDNKTFFLRFRAITNASDEYFRVDGVSLEGSPIDVCQNIEGIQAQPPQGYIVKNINDQSQCVPEFVDVTLCKTDDAQVPVGLSGWTLTLDGQGNNDHQGVTGQDGCYTFDNIPYGNYTAGEVLQANWSQVSLPNGNGAIQAYQEQNGPYYIRNHYTPPTPTTATLNAQKIICDSEDDLPNWGTGPNVTATTAADFLAEDLAKDQKQDCRLAAWEFQWSLDGVGNPEDNNTATTIANWNNFTSTASVPAGRIWAREVFKDGYIPFTGQNTDQPVSAEFYCASDVLHYDNWEFIDTVAGQTYYCVAFNVPIEDEKPLVCDPEVNLLKNGGFETPDVATGNYGIFPQGTTGLEWLVDWVSEQIGVAGLEIQDNVAGTPAEGAQFAELDGNHPVKIWQDVPTIPGKEYKLTFKYSPRPGTQSGTNKIEARANGSLLGALLSGVGGGSTVWSDETRTFVADSGMTKVEFIDIDTDNSFGGYLDNVELTCVGDPAPECDETAAQTIVSDATTKVGDGNAVALSFIHSAWTAAIPGATWIWATDPVESPTNDVDLTKTFTKTFNITGTPTSGTLQVAADNSYSVKVNGNIVPVVFDQDNFRAETQDTYDVSAFLVGGLNTLEITVTNWEVGQDGNPANNPAGLMYKLSLTNNECVVPPPSCEIGYTWDKIKEMCVPNDTTSDVTICKYDENDNSLSNWQVMLLDARRDYIDVKPDGQSYTIPGVPSGNWVMVAEGQYVYRGTLGAEYSDAAFSKRDPSDSVWGGIFTPWVLVNNFPDPNKGWLGVMFNNALTDWGSVFNNSHTYALATTTNASSDFSFKILDDYYGDNSGSVRVSVYPGYMGYTGENGCTTFVDVPFGSYLVDEVPQDGWEKLPKSNSEVQVDSSQESFALYNNNTQNDNAPQCSDDKDNDDEEDALSDENDPGCHSDGNVNNPQSYNPEDNDESNTPTQCSDGISNDEDGLIDSLDPGCLSGEGGSWNPLDNDETDPVSDEPENTNRSGSRARGGSVLGAFTGPAVLGDSMCGEYITDYIKFGAKNDKANVMRLQTFLNEYLGLKLTVDGFYGPATFNAVKQFQIKEASEVLNPWIGVTLKNTIATGWVYKTTKRWINMIKCPDLNIPQFEKSQLTVN